MARDGFNREIDYLRVSVTDRCNLSCVYCMPRRRRRSFRAGDILTSDEIRMIARVAMRFGLRKIRLTGGEPLVRDDILSIVSSLKRLGVRELGLTTNGVLFTGMASKLKEAGLDRVNISLDTLDPEKYEGITGGGRLGNTLEAVEEAGLAGLTPVKINMVPMRGVNDDEILDFARLTLHKPYHVRFIEFMPSGRGSLWDERKCVKTWEVKRRVTDALGPLEKLRFRGRGPSRNYRIEGAAGVLGFISPVSHDFCYRCNRLRINAVGKIRPCLFSRTEVDIGTPMRRGAGEKEIERLFALAIQVKPEGGYLNGHEEASVPTMSRIGG
jgi:cyclic pyranopterin phosphate synthase